LYKRKSGLLRAAGDLHDRLMLRVRNAANAGDAAEKIHGVFRQNIAGLRGRVLDGCGNRDAVRGYGYGLFLRAAFRREEPRSVALSQSSTG
jgi:hypothetical protein